MTRILIVAVVFVSSLACTGLEGIMTPLSPAPEVEVEVEVGTAPPPHDPAPAPRETGPATAHMVILGGAPDRDAAQRILDGLSPDVPRTGGYPTLEHSDEIEGLNPGFWIVVGAVARDEATAKAMAEALGEHVPGTYVRQVEVPASKIEGASCPSDPRCGGGFGWRAVVIFKRISIEPDGWDSTSAEVTAVLGRARIPTERVNPNDPLQVKVPLGGDVVEIDIAPFQGELYGYVFAAEGRKPRYQQASSAVQVLSVASAYFGVDLLAIDE
ncbi:MAG TPA: hypothetical protein ENK18_01415 [Deltaproteobacteria bacterium]|nr:hypothetical protein [Deltaproteobacteria bacterium]